jgi:hypothetical protein
MRLSTWKFELETEQVYSSRDAIVWITLDSGRPQGKQVDPTTLTLVKLPICLDFSSRGARSSTGDAVGWTIEAFRL